MGPEVGNQPRPKLTTKVGFIFVGFLDVQKGLGHLSNAILLKSM